MFTKKCGLSVAAVFATIFILDNLTHGFLLKDLYTETKDLWRSPEEMKINFPYILIGYFVFATFISGIFKQYILIGPKKELQQKAIKGGANIGFLLGLSLFFMYFYMPIPLILGVAWLVSYVVMGIAVGYVLYLLDR